MFNRDPNRPAVNRSQGRPTANDPSSWLKSATWAGAGSQAVAGTSQGTLTMSFVWMFLGLLVSAAAGAFTIANPALLNAALNNFLLFILAELALVFVVSLGINRIGPMPALGLFFAYALLNGVTISLVVLAYTVDPLTGQVTGSGISAALSSFLGASAIFGAAALYGVVTKRDLTSLGGILVMGLVGLLVMMIVQVLFFADSTAFSLAIGVIGVVIFTALTAFDVQRIQNGRLSWIKSREGASVIGALALYLDFVNLFLMLLRIFGGGRR
jgi:FtsH-binding integral membrane protein